MAARSPASRSGPRVSHDAPPLAVIALGQFRQLQLTFKAFSSGVGMSCGPFDAGPAPVARGSKDDSPTLTLPSYPRLARQDGAMARRLHQASRQPLGSLARLIPDRSRRGAAVGQQG